jgi:hypothetical protein
MLLPKRGATVDFWSGIYILKIGGKIAIYKYNIMNQENEHARNPNSRMLITRTAFAAFLDTVAADAAEGKVT